MAQFLRPDVYVQETDRIARRVEGVSTSITAFLGIAQRGPIGVPIKIFGVKDFERIFGSPVLGESLHFAVDGFFKNGGRQAYVSRLGHYSDLAANTIAAAVAQVEVNGLGVASFARFVGSVDVTTVVLQPGWTLTFDINNLGGLVATVQAVAAIVNGLGGTFPAGGAGDTAQVKINNGPTQAIDLSGVGAGIANYVAALNAQIAGAWVEDNAGELRITTDRKGSSASIQFLNFGVSFAASTGLSVGTTASAGPNNVSNVDLVTFAEIKAMLEDAVKTVTPGDRVVATQTSSGFLILTGTAGVAGPASEIDLSAGTAGFIAALGLGLLGTQGANPAAVGSATSAAPSLRIKAGFRGEVSPGVDGNNFSCSITLEPLFPSRGAGLDLAANAAAAATQIRLTSRAGIRVGSILKLNDGVNTEYVRVLDSETQIVGSTVQHWITLTAPLVNPFVAANTTVQSQEHTLVVFYNGVEIERWQSVSMNPDAEHYVETKINDSETGSIFITVVDLALAFPGNILQDMAETSLTGGTSERTGFTATDIIGDATAKNGMYALDNAQDMNLLCIPPSYGDTSTIPANSIVHNAMLAYIEGRADSFAILDMPDDLNAAAAATYRQDVLGADSKWGALYWPHIQVADPLGVGTRPTVFVPPSGHIAGIYARVDNLPNPDGGVAATPAGEGNFGKIVGAVGLRYYADDRDHDSLNPIGVNVIRKFSRGGPAAPGIVVMGGRTLSSDLNFVYIGIRRLLTYVGQSLKAGFRFALFRNNDFRLWGQLTDLATEFLRNLHRAGQLRGRSAEEAYFVKIDGTLNDANAIASGLLIAEVGVAGQKPAEFIIIRLSQLQTGSAAVAEFAA